MFDLHQDKPPPLIRRRDIFEVSERACADGVIERPVDSTELDVVLDQVRDAGDESLAICFLHCYVEEVTERAVKERLQARGLRLATTSNERAARRERMWW